MSGWTDEPSPYFGLIDSERAAAEAVGQPATKIDLIARLREATGLGLREAREAVEDYLARAGSVAGGKVGWVDDLLDAERAAAEREGRPITKILLIRALRGASPDLELKGANQAVTDYLRRRGATLPFGAGPVVPVLVLLAVLVGIGLCYYTIAG